MAEQQGPSKNDIQTILKRLRSQGPNKVCFDCCAKNPTWATVTYGVFICIDCSAVHRSLGVHLTFVRSTQLDTNWTWLQLRQMQLGGNSNAQTFFQQHNCTTNDANQKYNSRAAQLYREKLHNAAVQAMKIHGTKPIIEATNETQAEETKKEVDFFEEHEKFQLADDNLLVLADTPPINSIAPQTSVSSGASSLSSGQPSVAGILSPSAVPEAQGEIKHIIGNRKPMAKKSGLGAKKGLGAQRVKTNFSEIEQRAAMADLMKETAAQEAKLQAERTAEEEEKQIASMRLAYQDLSIAQKKEEDKLRTTDPKKATQIERLGMGFASRSGVSHSAMSDMETIDQDAPVKTSLAMSRRGKSLYDREEDDDFPYGSGFGSFKSEAKSMDVLVTLIREEEWDDEWDRDAEVNRERNRDRDRDRRYNDLDPDMITLEQIERKEKEKSRTGWNSERAVSGTKSFDSTPAGNEAQKKFGGAKAISSDQFFADSDANSWERKANLSRFEGSTSISSADYFGNGSSNVGSQSGYSQMSAPDLEDMRESVRQGVTKVAGKLSSLANGVMSSFQDRYGGF